MNPLFMNEHKKNNELILTETNSGSLSSYRVRFSSLLIFFSYQYAKGAKTDFKEWMSEDAEARSRMRALYQSQGILRSVAAAGKEKEEGDAKFRDYLDWSEPVTRASPHRLLAMLRGAEAGDGSFGVPPSGR